MHMCGFWHTSTHKRNVIMSLHRFKNFLEKVQSNYEKKKKVVILSGTLNSKTEA